MQADNGHRALALDTVTQLRAGGRYVSAYFLGLAMLALDEQDEAVTLLQQALERHEWFLVMAPHEPRLDGIRERPAVAAILRQVKPAVRHHAPVPQLWT